MLPAACIVLALLFSGSATALLSSGDAESQHLVGFGDGESDEVVRELEALGVRVLRVDERLDFALVETKDVKLLEGLVGSLLKYVESEGESRISGAQWNGAQWNGAQWNGAQWNGAQWNGAQWNGEGGDPGASTQWGLEATRAPEAWDSLGEPSHEAQLCVVDSGVESSHEDLSSQLWTSESGAHGKSWVSSGLEDEAGHGTHMAGVSGAARGNGVGIAGIGDGSLIAAKVFDADGKGRTSDVASAIAWCADVGADVILMALSVDGKPKTVDRALAFADERGAVLVGSAGNGGPCDTCVAYPARDPRVLAVAAVAPDDKSADFSASGPEIDLAAPGTDIVGTMTGDSYASGSGTSQAAAFAAGAAVLLAEHEPGLSPAQTRERLVESARDVGPDGRDDATGAGVLDVAAAVGA